MGGRQSSNVNSPRLAQAGNGAGHTSTAASTGLGLFSGHHQRTGPSSTSGGASAGAQDARQRARSLSSVLNGQTLGIQSSGAAPSAVFGASGSPDSEEGTPEELPFSRVFAAHSLPVQLVSFNGIKCPVCSKFVLPDDVECHLVICLTKPRISYNEDVLTEDKGECVICLEELLTGNTIARLPCLCVYHKACIDAWFEVNRSCPEHPLD